MGIKITTKKDMDTSNLSIELYHLQSNVIGLFKHRYSNSFEMVISNDGGFLKTIHIGTLGGLIENHISKTEGKLVLFDAGETLYSLLSNPFKLDNYCRETMSNESVVVQSNQNKWVPVSSDEYEDLKFIMYNSLPLKTNNSFHVYEDIYSIDGITYRRLYALSDNVKDSKPIIERFIE